MYLSDIQPQYFPRLHYFARMFSSDVFVLRDDVQFVRNHRYPDGNRGTSFQAHTPIKTQNGAQLLPVSVTKGGLLPICQTALSYDQPWVRKHLNIIKSNYSRAPNAKRLLPELEKLLNVPYDTVGQLNTATICWAICKILGQDRESSSIDEINEILREYSPTRLRYIATGSRHFSGNGTSMNNSAQASATDRIVSLCKSFSAASYITGETAFQAYMETALFEDNNIAITIQNWRCASYHQQNEKCGFIRNLSIIDLLMNVPQKEALSVLINQ